MHEGSAREMNDETPERLKQFRAQYQGCGEGGRGRRWLKAFLLVAAVLLGLWGADVFLRGAIASSTARPGGMSADEWREYAIYLEGKALPDKALEAYQKYLETALLSDGERAKVCFSMATLAADTGNYRDALAALYQAEMLAPNTALKPEIDKKVVLCLERLNRKDELRRELRKRSGADTSSTGTTPGDTVLAECGDTVFTMHDLERELDALPPGARSKLNTPEAKSDYLRSLVARRMLLEKALRLELDKDPEILDRLAMERDALVVQKLIDEGMAGQSEPTPEDVERFYRAEQERFEKPGTTEVLPFEQVKERAAQMLRAQREQEHFARLIDETLKESNVTFHMDRLKTEEAGAVP